MKTIVIDGYNVIHRVPQFDIECGRSLKAGRDALLSAVIRSKNKGRQFIVVFEGRDGYRGSFEPFRYGGIGVVFTQTGQEADRWIVDTLKIAKNPQDYVVVSDDNYVCNHARNFGVDVMSAACFFKQAMPNPSRGNRADLEKTTGAIDTKGINDELRKLWGV